LVVGDVGGEGVGRGEGWGGGGGGGVAGGRRQQSYYLNFGMKIFLGHRLPGLDLAVTVAYLTVSSMQHLF